MIRQLELCSLMPFVSRITLSMLVLLFFSNKGTAAGVSPYLPLNTSPEIERKIERVLIMAGTSVVRRPIPAALVKGSLPRACLVDKKLCDEVGDYLNRFEQDSGLTQVSLDLGVATGSADKPLPNSHGRTIKSDWQLVGGGFYQPTDYLLINGGAIAYQGRSLPSGSFLSVGADWAQLDVGFRDHWFSPMGTSAFLISTEAPTMPSVTLSNYRPLGPFGFTYELFAAQMSKQQNIKYLDSTTEGHPHLTGVQFGVEPVPGYALTVNRLMQYGGGARGGSSLEDIFNAFYKNNTSNSNISDNVSSGHLEFGNQAAGVAATMQFEGRVPFSVNMEYSGEDGSYAGNHRLGDVGVSLGVDFPILWHKYDFKYEVSEWQNVWYTHHIYPRGLTNNDLVIGHWYADQRQFGDRVGGKAHLLNLGMYTDDGESWRATYRTMGFDSSFGYAISPPVPYVDQHEVGVSYARELFGYRATLSLNAGRDVINNRYGRLNISTDLIKTRKKLNADGGYNSSIVNNYDLFIDLGINKNRIQPWIVPGDSPWEYKAADYHVGFGVRKAIGEKSDIGSRIELDRVSARNLFSFRAVDYRYRMHGGPALSAFIGIGRYSDGAPAYGWYDGIGVGWNDVMPYWSLNMDLRNYNKLSRNRVLANDPPETRALPRIHYDIQGISLYLSRSL